MGRWPLFPMLALTLLLATGCLMPAAQQEGGDVRFDTVRFETSHGTFALILYPEEAPASVAFLQRLVAEGYYNGREFNRVIPGFVIQEVDRLGGATDHPDKVPGEFGTRAMFSAGAIGIARSEHPDSGGSEFFVMDFAHSHLYGNYTAFGQVVEGLDVVRAIARVETVETPGVFVPGLPVGVHERVAVEPGRILRATLGDMVLPAAEAARYPLVVGETTRTDSARYTLEWARNLAAGAPERLTWYVYTAGDAPARIESYRVVVDGPGGQFEVLTTADPADARVRHFPWPAPGTPGEYTVTLVDGREALASTTVTAR